MSICQQQWMTRVARSGLCAAVVMALLARQQQPRSKVSRHGSCWHQLQYHHTARKAPNVCDLQQTCHYSVAARHVLYQHSMLVCQTVLLSCLSAAQARLASAGTTPPAAQVQLQMLQASQQQLRRQQLCGSLPGAQPCLLARRTTCC
jgi:hypothetical protein